MRVKLGSFEIQIDEQDAYFLSKEAGYSFQVQDRSTKNRKRSYVKARKNPNGDGAPYLHRLIMDAKKGEDVDHINGDGTDNRRENLRVCDRSKNMANQIRASGELGYRGVKRMAKGPNFVAILSVNHKNITINAIPTIEQAARTRDFMALDHFGRFAKLNFPDSMSEWLEAKIEGRSLYAIHAPECPKTKNRRSWCRCGATLDGRSKAYVVSTANRRLRAREMEGAA